METLITDANGYFDCHYSHPTYSFDFTKMRNFTKKSKVKILSSRVEEVKEWVEISS